MIIIRRYLIKCVTLLYSTYQYFIFYYMLPIKITYVNLYIIFFILDFKILKTTLYSIYINDDYY